MKPSESGPDVKCRRAAGLAKGSFLSLLPRAFTYPLVGRGKFMLLGATVGLTIVGLLAGAIGLIFGYLLAGYLAMYLFEVIGTSAGKSDEPPDWPDLRNVDDTVRPLLLVIGCLALVFGPSIVYQYGPPFLRFTVDWDAWTPQKRVFWWLLGAGAVYAPMALLAVAMFDSIAALNPIRVLVGIVKVLPFYLVALAMVAIVGAMVLITTEYLGAVPLVKPAAVIYLLVAEGRILGLIYRTQAARLKWFP